MTFEVIIDKQKMGCSFSSILANNKNPTKDMKTLKDIVLECEGNHIELERRLKQGAIQWVKYQRILPASSCGVLAVESWIMHFFNIQNSDLK